MTLCPECQTEHRTKTTHPHVPDDLCFGCYFWREQVARFDDRSIIVHGHHYRIGTQTTDVPSTFRGFGGRPFAIQHHDGRLIETHDLSHQGDIPAHFRTRLPDNAQFIVHPSPRALAVWETT